MKCSPQTSLQTANGIRLHDSHAEVLAIRAFNRVLLDQCLQLACGHDTKVNGLVLLERITPNGKETPLFSIRKHIKLHMYCSECPCGDASMEMVMSRQHDSTPWSVTNAIAVADADSLLGRGHFDLLGIARRKPARPDAPLTLSKSCSDKLALRQCLSLLSSTTSLFVSPSEAYLQTLVLPTSQVCKPALERAFGRNGRLRSVADRLDLYGYEFLPFEIGTTGAATFEYARESPHTKHKASNIACVTSGLKSEILINGVLQGRKQSDTRAIPSICRRAMWQSAYELAAALNETDLRAVTQQTSYMSLKAATVLQSRVRAKQLVITESLSPWPKNTADSTWSIF